MSHLQPRLTRQRVRCRSEFSGPVAQPVGGTEPLLAGLLDLSNLPFEINVSSRDAEVQVDGHWVPAAVSPTPLYDPTGAAIALVVTDDNKVEGRKLVTDRAIGDQWLVTSGLKPGDKLIVEGTDRVKPGQTVKTAPVALAKAK